MPGRRKGKGKKIGIIGFRKPASPADFKRQSVAFLQAVAQLAKIEKRAERRLVKFLAKGIPKGKKGMLQHLDLRLSKGRKDLQLFGQFAKMLEFQRRYYDFDPKPSLTAAQLMREQNINTRMIEIKKREIELLTEARQAVQKYGLGHQVAEQALGEIVSELLRLERELREL